jgi:hypothetical protein
MKTRAAVGALLAGALLLPVAAWAAEKIPVDTDLLEFLGSIDSEGEGWSEFLGHADLDKPKAPTKPPAAKPEPPKPPVKQPPNGADK